MDVNPDPRSTWGASEEYKAAWREKYGNGKAPTEAAPSAPSSTKPSQTYSASTTPGGGTNSGTPEGSAPTTPTTGSTPTTP